MTESVVLLLLIDKSVSLQAEAMASPEQYTIVLP
jgi:hypothetical protein